MKMKIVTDNNNWLMEKTWVQEMTNHVCSVYRDDVSFLVNILKCSSYFLVNTFLSIYKKKCIQRHDNGKRKWWYNNVWLYWRRWDWWNWRSLIMGLMKVKETQKPQKMMIQVNLQQIIGVLFFPHQLIEPRWHQLQPLLLLPHQPNKPPGLMTCEWNSKRKLSMAAMDMCGRQTQSADHQPEHEFIISSQSCRWPPLGVTRFSQHHSTVLTTLHLIS